MLQVAKNEEAEEEEEQDVIIEGVWGVIGTRTPGLLAAICQNQSLPSVCLCPIPHSLGTFMMPLGPRLLSLMAWTCCAVPHTGSRVTGRG